MNSSDLRLSLSFCELKIKGGRGELKNKVKMGREYFQIKQGWCRRLGRHFIQYLMLCPIWYHLNDLKNVKSTLGRVLLLVKFEASYVFSQAQWPILCGYQWGYSGPLGRMATGHAITTILPQYTKILLVIINRVIKNRKSPHPI